MQQVHSQRDQKIAGKPGEQKEERVVVSAPAEREPVDLGLTQQISQRRAGLGPGLTLCLRSAPNDVFTLLSREPRVLAGVAVDSVEQGKIKKAEEAGSGEAPAPADLDEDESDDDDSSVRRIETLLFECYSVLFGVILE